MRRQASSNPGAGNALFRSSYIACVVAVRLPASLISLAIILCSLRFLPSTGNPILLLGNAWFNSGLSCFQRTVAILYLVPAIGDAAQFIVVDFVQKFKMDGHTQGRDPLQAAILNEWRLPTSDTLADVSEASLDRCYHRGPLSGSIQ